MNRVVGLLAAFGILVAPVVSHAAEKTTCKDVAQTYGEYASLRDAGVSQEAVQRVIANDPNWSTVIKLAMLERLAAVYSNKTLTPAAAYANTLRTCKEP